MKINWGTGIVITFVIFAGLLTWAVVESFQADHHLVDDDYYEAELKYGNRMEEIKRVNELGAEFSIKESADLITIQFPTNWNINKLTGNVHMYKPDDERLDKKYDLKLNEASRFLISKKQFKSGKWKLILHWEYEAKVYHQEETLFL